MNEVRGAEIRQTAPEPNNNPSTVPARRLKRGWGCGILLLLTAAIMLGHLNLRLHTGALKCHSNLIFLAYCLKQYAEDYGGYPPDRFNHDGLRQARPEPALFVCPFHQARRCYFNGMPKLEYWQASEWRNCPLLMELPGNGQILTVSFLHGETKRFPANHAVNFEQAIRFLDDTFHYQPEILTQIQREARLLDSMADHHIQGTRQP